MSSFRESVITGGNGRSGVVKPESHESNSDHPIELGKDFCSLYRKVACISGDTTYRSILDLPMLGALSGLPTPTTVRTGLLTTNVTRVFDVRNLGNAVLRKSS